MFAMISAYIIIITFQGISYASLIGASPAIWFISYSMKNNLIDSGSFIVFVPTALAIWLVGYVLATMTGDFAGIFMIFFILMMLISLFTRFLFTVGCMVICGIIGEAFFSHLWT